MKNRFYGFLLLVAIVFFGSIYIYFKLDKAEKEKILEENTGSLEQIILQKVEEKEVLSDENINPNDYFAYFNISGEKFYFDIKEQKLELKNNEKSIGFFEVVAKTDLNISQIFGLEKGFLIEFGEKKYIYSKKYGILKQFSTKLEITYAKYSDGNYIFYSEGKGSFVLYKNESDLEYFALFSDFIFENENGYIGLLKNEQEKQKFGINSNKTVLYYYDFMQKSGKIIFESDFEIEKFYKEENKIFLINTSGEKYKLKNY